MFGSLPAGGGVSVSDEGRGGGTFHLVTASITSSFLYSNDLPWVRLCPCVTVSVLGHIVYRQKVVWQPGDSAHTKISVTRTIT